MREIAILSAVAAVCLAAGGFVASRLRTSPAERERRRRTLVSRNGRLIDGTATDFHNGVIYYTYTWRGVEYSSAQDLSSLPEMLPDPPDRLIGGVTVKFLPRDPSNSIVMAENWTGFPVTRLRAS